MVCIPCIVAPVLLFIWYRFIQPIVLKFWNPWAPQKAVKTSANSENKEAEKISCPFSSKTEAEPVQPTEAVDKELSSKKLE